VEKKFARRETEIRAERRKQLIREARTETRTHQGLARSQLCGRRRRAPATAPPVAAAPGSATDGRRSSLCSVGDHVREETQGDSGAR